MSISLYILNILATFDDAFNLNQAHLIVLSSFLYKTANTHLSICKKKIVRFGKIKHIMHFD